MDPLDLTVDLSATSPEQLAELITGASTEFNALNETVGDGVPTPEQLSRLTDLGNFSARARVELARRSVTAPVPDAPAPVVEPAPAPELAADSEPAPAPAPAPNVAPLAPTGTRVAPLFASADVPGLPAGGQIDWSDLGRAFVARFGSLPKMSAAGASRTPFSNRYGIASLRYEFSPEFQISGSDGQAAVAAAERAAAMDNLSASGGWCAPSETLYDLCEMETDAGLVSFPEIQATRGGFFHTTGPNFSDIFNDSGFCFTEAQDIAGDYDSESPGDQGKPCYTVGCPDFEETRLDVCGICVRAGYLQSRAYPEMVDRTVRGVLIGHRHRVSSRLIASVIAGSTTVNVPIVDANPGAISPILEALEMQKLSINYGYRRSPDAPVEIIAPVWFHAALRADASRRPGVDLISLSDERINAWLRERGIMPQFVYNWQDLGASITAWPASIQVLMYPAGTWVKATSGVIDLGVIHDSTLMAFNNYSAAFSEEGLAMLKRCPDSRRLVIPFCPSGVVGAQTLTVCSESPA